MKSLGATMLFVVCALVLSSSAVAAQDAASYYAQKDYRNAAAAYQRAVEADPANAMRYRLAVSLQALGKLDEAARGQALQHGLQPFSVYYRLAGLESQRGSPDVAIADLQKANLADSVDALGKKLKSRMRLRRCPMPA